MSEYTIGRRLISVQININGRKLEVTPDEITSWESRPKVDQKMHLPVSGNTDFANFYQGWEGQFEVTRTSNTLDVFQALMEADYYSGVIDAGGTIIEAIQNEDGTTSQFIYTKVKLKADSFGPYTGDNFVNVKFSFVASRRLVLNQ